MNKAKCERCGIRYGRLSGVGKRVHKEKGIRLCNDCVRDYYKRKVRK